jgi:hypothetical protein
MKKNIKEIGYLFKKNYVRFGGFIKSNFVISVLLVFGFFLICFLFIYISLPVVSSGDDHYFHFRFAEQLVQNGFFNSFHHFQTLYFTNITNGEHLMYYNFLFYAVLIPFTFLNPLFLGIKLFAVFSVALIGTILYFLFKKMDIRYSFFWTVGFFSAIGVGSFWRLFLSRPFVLSPIIILLLIFAIHKKRYFWIFFLSFICLFWHTATFLVPLMGAVVYFLVYFFYQKKYLWKELLLVFLGTLFSVFVAFLVDSGFFISIRDNLFSVLSSVLNTKVNISEGNEVYPKNFFDLFNQNVFLCVMFLSAVVVYVLAFLEEIKKVSNFDNVSKSRKIITMVFFVLSSVFIVAISNISNRFTDFFIFFGWIFIVFVFSELFSYIEFTKINLKKFFGYAFFVCLIYLFFNNSLQLNDMFASSGSRPETFKEVGSYLSKNLKKGDIVFNVDWGWFPQLYYYAPEQNYVIGLEPKLTYLYNPRLYWLWQNIGKGYVCENEKCPEIEQRDTQEMRDKEEILPWIKEKGNNIADIVISDFKSHYIVSSRDYVQLNNVLNNSKRFEKVLNNKDQYFIYKILP